ncbi:MAG: hypothetical protein EBV01_09300 [Betaproteobacteria bacterium]|nr:hypothetical protein [Betaproteobacteria bacterium]NBP35585.1 hypothetical protein [Betaproteobacteria bacterium]NCV13721.1 hypothetical protein [Betaproteobacteria bacterium]NCY06848.1 hypothetical protein [Betaproteobacteria bacterium]NDC02557.1 hypothetical protein [Betaproteobacteria bacterium]
MTWSRQIGILYAVYSIRGLQGPWSGPLRAPVLAALNRALQKTVFLNVESVKSQLQGGTKDLQSGLSFTFVAIGG